MALKQFQSGEKIHSKGEPLKEYELVLKGSVALSISRRSSVELYPGTILGPLDEKDGKYIKDYTAKGDVMLYGYSLGESDLVSYIVDQNKKIAPQMASASLKNLHSLKESIAFLSEYAQMKKEDIERRKSEYKELSARLKKRPKVFPELKIIPDPPDISIEGWREAFIEALVENDELLKEKLFSIGGPVCTGIVMTVASFARSLMDSVLEIDRYINELDETSHDFLLAYDELETEQKNIEHAKELDRAMTRGAMPDLSKAAETIVSYSGLDKEKREEFFALFNEYTALPDRSESSDDIRKLRRKLTQWYYRIYEGVFFKSLEEKKLPIEIKMFLTTGFFDPKIAGEENTLILFNYVLDYDPDPKEEVFTVYEWLRRIYERKNEPSRNEFDMDYPASLRERKGNGEITEQMYEKYLRDPSEMVRFEMTNLFELGNRMTFGRPSAFFPFFDSVNVQMPLEKIYMKADRIREELGNLRELDFQCFYREDIYQNEKAGIPQMVVHNEYLPYFILMPNCGSRSVLWQEIEGKKRSTHSRMLMPIFNLEDLSDSIIQVCGEFRWEMCKTEQGVHWNDLSEPSLTAEYSDYLQYFRKNQSLNPEQREKVKKVLQKAANNYRRVFTADYLVYIKYESKGALRLNKVAREILFSYCPFGAKARETVGQNPQYQPLINRMQNKTSQKARPVSNIRQKLENKGERIPEEIEKELAFYRL